MPTSVALSTHFKDFVRQQVDSGRYNNVSEVIRAGLRLLETQEAEQEAKLQRLREAIALGMNSSGIPADEVFDRLEAKYLAMTESVE